MNIYLVDTVVSTPNEFNNDFGYCDSPTLPSTVTTRPDVIVMEKNRLPQNNWAYPLHILGHFFGLRHTDAQISPTVGVVPSNPNTLSQEYVDGSNCYVHGDGFCDTEADPGASGATHDAKGDLYLRPIDNLMSGYSTRCRFTLEQFNYMANSILTSRKYLH